GARARGGERRQADRHVGPRDRARACPRGARRACADLGATRRGNRGRYGGPPRAREALVSRPEDAPPVRVYSYGLPLGPAPECADLVDEQIVLARRYHDDLIAVERARRQAVRAIMGEV